MWCSSRSELKDGFYLMWWSNKERKNVACQIFFPKQSQLFHQSITVMKSCKSVFCCKSMLTHDTYGLCDRKVLRWLNIYIYTVYEKKVAVLWHLPILCVLLTVEIFFASNWFMTLCVHQNFFIRFTFIVKKKKSVHTQICCYKDVFHCASTLWLWCTVINM